MDDFSAQPGVPNAYGLIGGEANAVGPGKRLNIVDHGMNVAEATVAPRIHHQWWPDEIRIEEGLSPDTVRLLAAKGHRLSLQDAMGSTQSIMIDHDAGILLGASDPRRPGALTAGY